MSKTEHLNIAFEREEAMALLSQLAIVALDQGATRAVKKMHESLLGPLNDLTEVSFTRFEAQSLWSNLDGISLNPSSQAAALRLNAAICGVKVEDYMKPEPPYLPMETTVHLPLEPINWHAISTLAAIFLATAIVLGLTLTAGFLVGVGSVPPPELQVVKENTPVLTDEQWDEIKTIGTLTTKSIEKTTGLSTQVRDFDKRILENERKLEILKNNIYILEQMADIHQRKINGMENTNTIVFSSQPKEDPPPKVEESKPTPDPEPPKSEKKRWTINPLNWFR